MLTNKQKESINEIVEKVDALLLEERDYFFQKILKKQPEVPQYNPVSREYADALDTIASYCETVSAAASLLGVSRTAFYGYKNGRIPIGARVGSRIKNIYEMINAQTPQG